MKIILKSLLELVLILIAVFCAAYIIISVIDYFEDNYKFETTRISNFQSDSSELMHREIIRKQRLFDRKSWNDADYIDKYLDRDTVEE